MLYMYLRKNHVLIYQFMICILFLQVCRASKQFLKLMERKAVIRIQDINPMLFSFVEELNEVKVNESKCSISQQLPTCTTSVTRLNV